MANPGIMFFDDFKGVTLQKHPTLEEKANKDKSLFLETMSRESNGKYSQTKQLPTLNKNINRLMKKRETPSKTMGIGINTNFPKLVTKKSENDTQSGQSEHDMLSPELERESSSTLINNPSLKIAAEEVINPDIHKDMQADQIRKRKTTEIFGLKHARQVPPTSFDVNPQGQNPLEKSKTQKERTQSVKWSKNDSVNSKAKRKNSKYYAKSDFSDIVDAVMSNRASILQPNSCNPSDESCSVKSRSKSSDGKSKASSKNSFGSKSFDISDNVGFIHKRRQSKGAGAAYQLVRQCLDNDSVLSSRASMDSTRSRHCKQLCRDFVRDYVWKYGKYGDTLSATMSVRLELRHYLKSLEEGINMDQINRCDNFLEETLDEYNEEIKEEEKKKQMASTRNVKRMTDRWMGRGDRLERESEFDKQMREKYLLTRTRKTARYQTQDPNKMKFALPKSYYNVTTYKDFALSTDKFVKGNRNQVVDGVWNVSRDAVNTFLREQSHIYDKIFVNVQQKDRKFDVCRNPFRY